MYLGIMLALITLGVILLLWGIQAANSVASSFSELFTGKPTDEAAILIIGGVLLLIVGTVGLLRGRHKNF